MKKKILLLCVSLLILSCTKENIIAEPTANFNISLTDYNTTNLGIYKGVFTTQGTLERGTLEINILTKTYSVATLKLVSGKEVYYKTSRMLNEGSTIENLEFRSTNSLNGNSSFLFSVENDGTHVQITNVVYNGITSGMIAAHETSRAPVIPITGTLDCDDCEAHPLLTTGLTGTFSLLFEGDGTSDDLVTAIADVGVIVIIDGIQFDCLDEGPFTSCAIGGFSSFPSNDIGWDGVHLYDNFADCSEAEGFWTLESVVHGVFTGTFKSDVDCFDLPEDGGDTCGTAEGITCGAFDTGDTSTATDSNGFGGPDYWYKFTGTGETIHLSLCGSSYDTYLTVLEDALGDCSLLFFVADNDDSDICGLGSLESELEFVSVPGTKYLFIVEGPTALDSGFYGLDVFCTPPAP